MSDSHDSESSSDSDPFDGDEPELIVCPQCAHPNLAFRTHCRKCGGRLIGSANLIPGADLIEWSPTDGARAASRNRAPIRVLLLLAAAVSAVLAGIAFRTPSPALALPALAAMVLFIFWAQRATGPAPGESNSQDAEGLLCPECGEPIATYDDLCAACGALVGMPDGDVPTGQEK